MDGNRRARRMWTPDGNTWPLQFAAYETYEKGVRVAVADVTGDGRAEIVAAPGSDSWTSVEIFDGRTYEHLSSLPPWPKGSWWNGAYVAAADTTGDSRAEVVVGLGPGCCTSLHMSGRPRRLGARKHVPVRRAERAGRARRGRRRLRGRPSRGVRGASLGRPGRHPSRNGWAAFRSFVPFATRALAARDRCGRPRRRRASRARHCRLALGRPAREGARHRHRCHARLVLPVRTATRDRARESPWATSTVTDVAR